MKFLKHRAFAVIVGSLWLAGVTAGFAFAWRYAGQPGTPAREPVRSWPAQLPRPAGKAMLVMALHPGCPCSRASVSELEQLISHCPGKFEGLLLFVPDAAGDSPQDSALWQTASTLPGVVCRVDDTRLSAGTFGARTSGQVFLYDEAGALRFSGGITESRGHAGANAGRQAIEAFLLEGTPPAPSTPVFGCALP